MTAKLEIWLRWGDIENESETFKETMAAIGELLHAVPWARIESDRDIFRAEHVIVISNLPEVVAEGFVARFAPSEPPKLYGTPRFLPAKLEEPKP